MLELFVISSVIINAKKLLIMMSDPVEKMIHNNKTSVAVKQV